MKNKNLYNELIVLRRKEIMLEQRGTSLIQEGVLIEAGKVFLQDAVKNLLATGAVVVTGGLPADTIVEVMFAVERTKKAFDMYNDIINAKDEAISISASFMNDMDTVNLEGNLEELVEIGKNSLLKLSKVGDSVLGKGESANMVGDLREKIDEFREEFLKFFKVQLSALADWISTLIPDDGGNVSSFIKVTMFTIIENMSQKPLTTLTGLVNKLPGEGGQIVFDEVKLESFLIDICNQVADGLESSPNISKNLGRMKKAQYYAAGGRIGNQFNKNLGKAAQLSSDFIMGGDSKTGQGARAFFDPMFRLDSIEDLIEKAPNYIRTTIIPMIPDAVDIYAKFMKYIIAFLGLLEKTMDGTLETDIKKFNNIAEPAEIENFNDQLIAEVRHSIRRQLKYRRVR